MRENLPVVHILCSKKIYIYINIKFWEICFAGQYLDINVNSIKEMKMYDKIWQWIWTIAGQAIQNELDKKEEMRLNLEFSKYTKLNNNSKSPFSYCVLIFVEQMVLRTGTDIMPNTFYTI